MNDSEAGQGRMSSDGDPIVIAFRLRERRSEIEEVLTRAFGAPKPGGLEDVEYVASLRRALAGFIGYTVECIESGEDEATPVPSEMVAHARRAARDGVDLETLLADLITAHTLLSDFVFREAVDLKGPGWSYAQELQGSILRRLASTLAREYKEEHDRRTASAGRRDRALVERLLLGAPVDPGELPYSLDEWHVAVIATGHRPMDAVQLLAENLGAALLATPRGEDTIWAWVGTPKRVSIDRVMATLERSSSHGGAEFAIGDPGRDVDGWRSTHLQAQAARAVAMQRPQRVTSFSAVALEAIALTTPDLSKSLHATFLAPWQERPGGDRLRRTLDAYFASGRKVSSTADALDVNRKTVENRLHAIERALGRPLDRCSAELEFVLRLESLVNGPGRS